MEKTIEQWEENLSKCKDIFLNKMIDYGTSWTVLRPSSITDQIYIKANRLRSIQEIGNRKVNESDDGEFIAIVNYCIMGIIQLKRTKCDYQELEQEEIIELYENISQDVKSLMIKKNHDYGEVWKLMRITSITDLILQKIIRVKKIEDNLGETIISEGIDANYQDMINYSIFSLILLNSK